MAEIQLGIKINANAADAVKGLIDTKKKTDDLETALAGAKDASAKLSPAFESASSEVDHLGIQVAHAKKALIDMAANGVAKTSQEYVSLKAEIKEMEAALKRSQTELKTHEKAFNSAESVVAKYVKQLDKIKPELEQQEAALKATGIDVANLAHEYDRLTEATRKAQAEAKQQQAAQAQRSKLADAKSTLGISTTSDIEAEILKAKRAYETLRTSGTASIADLHKAHGALQGKIKELHSTDLPKSESLFQRFGATAAGALAGISFSGLISKLFDSAKEISELDLRIKGLTKSTEDYNAVQAETARVAEEHSKNVLNVAESESHLLSLEESGIVTRKENIAILEGMDNVQSKTGASAESLANVMYGLSQALASPIVRAEDLNQVVEPLPGLLHKMDEAAGLSGGGFRKMVVDGKVTSEFLKEVLIRALEDYDGSAAKAAGGIGASTARMSNAWTSFAKEAAPAITKIYKSGADLVERYSHGAAMMLASFFTDTTFQWKSDTDKAAEAQQALADGLDKTTEAAKKLKTPIDATIDPLTGLKLTAQITSDVLGGFRQKVDDTRIALGTLEFYEKRGLATIEEVKTARAAQMAAERNFETVRTRAIEQTVSAIKALADETQAQDANGKAKEAALAQQIKFAELSANEASAIGEIAIAVKFQNEAVTRAGELKATQVANAQAAISAAERESELANRKLEQLRNTLTATGELTNKDKEALASANADVEAKTRQTQAAKLHYAELARLPESLMKVVTTQQLESAEVRKAYTEAQAALATHKQVKAEKDAGKASTEQLSKAESDGAAAIARLTEATNLYKGSAEGAKVATQKLTAAQLAARSLDMEQSAHNAAVAANRRQIADEAHALAQQKHADDQATIHDGESVAMMTDLATAALRSWGANLEKVIPMLMMKSGYDYFTYFEKVGEWLNQAKIQQEYVNSLTAKLITAAQTGAGLSGALADAQNAASKFSTGLDHLNSQRLEGLNAAIDQAKNKLRELENSAKSTLESLKNELDQLEGNTAAIENRRYAAQQAALKQQAEQLKGDDAGYKAALESQTLAEEIHRRKLAEAEAAATGNRTRANSSVAQPAVSGGSSGGLQPIHLISNMGGKKATVYGNADDHRALVDTLKFHGLTA